MFLQVAISPSFHLFPSFHLTFQRTDQIGLILYTCFILLKLSHQAYPFRDFQEN